mmetsp:Transcript_6836/g.7844  ORF Transcript_6836/g.7844 Transcript_6836/m.7844 type:complete len:214 (+) Transcript_6836:467-1108(+)|eukprot:CAMPEP_0184018764 /NCGR_PEP_ID=MMETSP0954-20121128/8340_1 /TAXON_ID=627963 /ORGANISM="Aplanochytrium sp, Strain PBS07" /LENGTH=213 /DNA_ID=CAMNT_0026300281 /DNA_START=397 /DNA_END=1038 /DNA_ORIENTATION=+
MSLDRARLLKAAEDERCFLNLALREQGIVGCNEEISVKSDREIVDLRRLRVCRDARLKVRQRKGSRKETTERVHVIYDFEVDDNGSLYVDDMRLTFYTKDKDRNKESLAYTLGKKLVKCFNKKDDDGLARLFSSDARIELPECTCNKYCIRESLEISTMKLRGVYESENCASFYIDAKAKGSKSVLPCVLFIEPSTSAKIARATFCVEKEPEI